MDEFDVSSQLSLNTLQMTIPKHTSSDQSLNTLKFDFPKFNYNKDFREFN